MKNVMYLAGALALALVASPAVAQSNNPPPDRDQATMQNHAMRHDSRMSHDEMSRHNDMSMHGRMSDRRMMRWCHSMSYRRMMHNWRCRSMMHRHHSDRMHHM
jgi:hypothetical protein